MLDGGKHPINLGTLCPWAKIHYKVTFLSPFSTFIAKNMQAARTRMDSSDSSRC